MTGYAEASLVQSLGWLEKSQAAIAHNLANVSTVGYQRRLAFASNDGDQQTQFQALLDGAAQPSLDYAEKIDWTPGESKPTGDRFHVALEGDGFMLAEVNGGIAATRRGELMIDADGYLALASGPRLLNEQGLPIQVGETSKIDIASNGAVTTVQDGTPIEIGRLGRFAVDRESLSPLPGGLWRLPSDVALPDPSSTTQIRQGYLQQGNVDALSELVRMIAVQRGYQANTRALQSFGRIHDTFISSFDR